MLSLLVKAMVRENNSRSGSLICLTTDARTNFNPPIASLLVTQKWRQDAKEVGRKERQKKFASKSAIPHSHIAKR